MFLVLVSGAAYAAPVLGPPTLPPRNPDRIVTAVDLHGDSDFQTTALTGTALGPDVPLATIAVRWGLIETDSSFGCSYSVQSTLYWKLDAGNGDVLYGQLVGGGGGVGDGSATVTFVLKATGGTGRFAGWNGWGTYTAVPDAFCGASFDGEWAVNRV